MDENKTLQGESPPDALAAENKNGEEKASDMEEKLAHDPE